MFTRMREASITMRVTDVFLFQWPRAFDIADRLHAFIQDMIAYYDVSLLPLFLHLRISVERVKFYHLICLESFHQEP